MKLEVKSKIRKEKKEKNEKKQKTSSWKPKKVTLKLTIEFECLTECWLENHW
jgi:hypothetical protein